MSSPPASSPSPRQRAGLRVPPPGSRARRNLEWAAVFAALLIAVWLSTQFPTAPQLLLLILLYAIAVNFSLPLRAGYIGLTPIVALLSLLTLEPTTALAAGLSGLPLAELVRPIWRPIWQSAVAGRPQRLGALALHLSALTASAALAAALQANPEAIAPWAARVGLDPVVARAALLATAVFLLFMAALAILWLAARQPLARLVVEAGGYLAGSAVLAVPLALFVAPADLSLPAFVIVSFATAVLAVITWTAWQRQHEIAQRLGQLNLLNELGASLRETLDLPTVLAQTGALLTRLIPADRVTLALRHPDGRWEQLAPSADAPLWPFEPDDLLRWVLDNAAVLDLDQAGMPHAYRRGLRLPEPEPAVWLGAPLKTADATIGVVGVQKYGADAEPFTRWNREMLVAIAGLAGSAVQNARLHSETVRLYNLTDAALARRLEQLQALLDAITEGVLLLDTQGQVVLVNPMAARLLGRSEGALSGTTLDDATAERMGLTTAERDVLLRDLAAGRLPQTDRQVYQWGGAGGRRFIERYTVPVQSADGRLMGWLIILRDVTEERERAEWRADLTRMIVHDLRNPVATLSSTVDVLERRLPEAQRAVVADLLVHARHGCTTLLEMVDSLMDINRAEAGRFIIDAEAMHLSHLAQQVFDSLRPLAVQRDVALTLDLAADLPVVWGDADVLRRVLVNLLDNALKFTPAGGRVHGELRRDSAASAEREDGVQVTVYDSGPGIPAEQRERIFERFVTFNRGGGQMRGAGLGLTYCKLAVEAHGGAITVDDAPGGGSAFRFTVPGVPHFA